MPLRDLSNVFDASLARIRQSCWVAALKTAGCLAVVVFIVSLNVAGAQEQSASRMSESMGEYVLGPEDVIKIWALGMEEISEKSVRVDPAGYIDLPVLGRLQVAGLTVEKLRERLLESLAIEVREPKVSVEIIEFGSQPVSVMGAVGLPGVHQLRGRKTLAEVLALAGGLREDAGPTIGITRTMEWGPIPLPSVEIDHSGRFSVAQIKLKKFLDAANPADNISIRPHDVITIPHAEMVYVIGAVRKPGGFLLNERESVSALQALSMAEGLGTTPAAQDSKILRIVPGTDQRQEIGIDLKRVLSGNAKDVSLQPNDILFVPTSASKQAARRALEAAVQTLSGVLIWRGPRP